MPESDLEITAARNAGVVRRYFDLLNTGDIAAAVQLLAPDTLNHGRPAGRERVQRVLSDIWTTFPDSHFTIDDLVAVGDAVVIRTTHGGTHRGACTLPIMGGLLVGVPPTGRSFEVQNIHWHTLKDGLMIEHRANRDDVGMMQQLGLLPTSPGAPRGEPSKDLNKAPPTELSAQIHCGLTPAG